MKKSLIVALMLMPMSLFAQKFAHFNSAEIIPNMAEYKQAQTEIQTLAETYDKDLKAMQDELQSKSEAYEKEQATLPDNIKQRREQELQELYQRLQQNYQDNQTALQKAQADKMSALQEKVIAALQQVGKAGGYIYIVDLSSGSIPFVNDAMSTDVSADVRKALGM